MKKALKNWRKFGVIIFGSILVASTLVPAGALADDLRVEIYKGSNAVSSFTIDAGASQQFTAKAFVGTDEVTDSTTFTWSMGAAWTPIQIGSVTQDGLYTAGSHTGQHSGALRLVGSYNSKTDLDTVSVYINAGVTPPPPTPTKVLDRVEIMSGSNALSSFTIDAGTNKQFAAKAIATDDSDITSSTTFTWSMGAAWTPIQIGSVTQDGLYTAGSHTGQHSGALRLVGSYNSKTDLDTVSVYINSVTPPANQPPNAVITATPTSGVTSLPVALSASASTDPDGTIVKYEWDYDGNGTFDADSGNDSTVNHNYGVGTWYPRVRVTDNDGATDTAVTATSIVVQPTPPEEDYLSYVVVTPNPWVMDMYDTKLFDATSYDQHDDVIDDGLVDYTWDVVNGGGDINSASGLFTADGVSGTFDHTVRVRAIYQGNTRYAQATVIVNPIYTQAVLERVEILPSSITIDKYDDYPFTARAYDTLNNQMFSGVTYTWDVIAGPGSVNQNGVYTATNSTNTATVQVEASQGNIHVYDTATVYITGSGGCTGILDRVELTPSTGYVTTGHSIDFDAQAYDTAGCLVSADLWFSVSNDSNGYIDQNGYFTARYNTGTFNDLVRVRASHDGDEAYDWATVVISTGDYEDHYIDANLHAYDETIGSDYRANEGDTVLYTLKLTNNRSNTLTDVVVTMDVPEYTTFISVSSQSGTPTISNRTITWNVGNLYANESRTMWLRVRVNTSVPDYAVVRGKAFVRADEISSGFWVYSNDLPVNGSIKGPIGPLTPTGAMEWILAIITALLATILTRQLMRTRRLIASLR